MEITSKCKIALNILRDMAVYTAHGCPASSLAFARKHQISRSYLESILARLKASGLIISQRGVSGGYMLAISPKSISIEDIVEAFPDKQHIREDLATQLWSDLDAYMHKQMSEIFLSDFLNFSTDSIKTHINFPKSLDKANAIRNINLDGKIEAQKIGPNSVFSFGKFLQK